MKSKFVVLLVLASALINSLWVLGAPPASGRVREFEFTYEVTLRDLPPKSNIVRIWVPIASSNSHQSVRVEKIIAPVPVRLSREAAFGNRMLYAEIRNPRSLTYRFAVSYLVTRWEYSKGGYTALMSYNRSQDPPSPGIARFLLPNRLIPTAGIIRQISTRVTQGKSGEIEKAYALYDYVFHTMRYDKTGTGWGHGDAIWACNAHRGNCTDFHSLFIALARAQGIPARFVIGFPLPPDAIHGTVPGYHCWAEFYVHGLGWVPADISEAWLNPSKRNFFFGSLDANRVRFSTGRDLELSPRQTGPPVNYFVYPYVEIDGKSFNQVAKQFSFHDSREVHGGNPR